MGLVGRADLVLGGFLFLVLPALVLGDCSTTDIKNCDVSDPKVVSSFMFNGTCNAEGMPVLVQSNVYDLSITFTPVETYTKPKSVVKVEVFGMVIPLNIENPEACEGKNLTCPLEADTEYVFVTTFDVHSKYQLYKPISLSVMWYLVDVETDDNTDVDVDVDVDVETDDYTDVDVEVDVDVDVDVDVETDDNTDVDVEVDVDVDVDVETDDYTDVDEKTKLIFCVEMPVVLKPKPAEDSDQQPGFRVVQ